jgi:hypothetical protein
MTTTNLGRKGERLLLSRMTYEELVLIANIMTDLEEPTNDVYLTIENRVRRYLSRSRKLILWQPPTWGDPVKTERGRKLAKVKDSDSLLRWGSAHLRLRWQDVLKTFKAYIVENRELHGFYCPLPPAALPRPQFLIRNPDDFASWITARMVANRQWHAIVRCARCDKYGAHRRSRPGMKYCGSTCQREANKDRAARKAADQPYPPYDSRRLKQLEEMGGKRGSLPRSLRIERSRIEARVKAKRGANHLH